MQLIAEAYDILKRGLGLSEDEIADIFLKWNKGVLDSFLIEITANILKFKDDDGEPVVTKILDKAGQKGTGKWTAIAALDAGTAGAQVVSMTEHMSDINQSPSSERLSSPVACLLSRRNVFARAKSLLALPRSLSVATSNSSLTISNRRYMRRRSSLTLKVSCS